MKPYPEILTLAINGTNTVAPNNATDNIIVAAPGAGARIRVFFLSCAQPQNNAANVMRLLYYHTAFNAANSLGNHNMIVGASPGPLSFYTQGVPLPENQPLGVRSFCTVASLGYQVACHYAIEAA